MKLKSNFKILLLVGILLLTAIVFNTNIVNATDVETEQTDVVTEQADETEQTEQTEQTDETDETIIQKSFDIISDTIVIDSMTEKEALKQDKSKLTEVINAKINEILKGNNINLDELNITIETDLSGFSDAWVGLRASNCGDTKSITVKYSNSDKRDNAYAETLNDKIENKIKDIVPEVLYYDVLAGEYMGSNNCLTTGGANKRIETVISNMLGDSDIEVYCYHNFGGNSQNGITSEASVPVYFIKDDIVYGIYTYNTCQVPIIIVPDEIKDTEENYIKYASDALKKCYKLTDKQISVERYTDETIKYHDVRKPNC